MICAGRPPGDKERKAIEDAAATILPQGCRRELYELARRYCPRVFPNYTARFDYPGKIGQIRLFAESGVRIPASETFSSTAQFADRHGHRPAGLPFSFPFVVKFDWGGEGQTVSLVESVSDMETVLASAAACERAGLSGFILQEFIPCDNRVLRVAVIGSKAISYWRVGAKSDRSLVSAGAGARIDFNTDPDLQHRAVTAVQQFASATRIDLAGIDLLYASGVGEEEPYFLEINYFFGRRGLGGSQAFYELLSAEICAWLRRNGLALQTGESRQ